MLGILFCERRTDLETQGVEGLWFEVNIKAKKDLS